jgi:hypothetical protein
MTLFNSIREENTLELIFCLPPADKINPLGNPLADLMADIIEHEGEGSFY